MANWQKSRKPFFITQLEIKIMKIGNVKSIMSIVLMGLFLTAMAPTDMLSQSNRKKKTQKEKVVTPVKHYKQQPRRGAQVTVLPKKTVVVTHSNNKYHYRNGIYYRPVNGSYVVSAPPVGIRVKLLPPNPYKVWHSGRSYYYYYGTYYLPVNGNEYEVVSAPLGARIDALPDGYDVFELDGQVYYRLDETYYKAVIEDNGNVVYEVVRI